MSSGSSVRRFGSSSASGRRSARRAERPGVAEGARPDARVGTAPDRRRHAQPPDRAGRRGADDDAARMTPTADTAEEAPRVAVVGAGAWGTTLALILARAEPVILLSHSAEAAARLTETRQNERRLPGVELPARVDITADQGALRVATELVILAVPSAHLRETVQRIAGAIPATADVLSVAKGLENETLLRMTEVIADASAAAGAPIEPGRIAALSGPNLAQEIARGLPASAVIASADPALGDRIVERLSRREFRLYTNPDVL